MNTEIQEKVNLENIDEIQNDKDFIDLLDRRKLAKNFVTVLMSQEAKVFSINGGWGSGKTWFLKFIEDECKEKIHFIKYNVWENDYLENPFRAIMSELLEKLTSLIKEDKIFAGTKLEEVTKDIDKLKVSFQKLFELTRKFKFTPQITYGLPDGSSVSGAISIEHKNSEIDVYENMKIEKENFTNSLKSLLKIMDTKQIILAIDELDRCRPDYAIKTLEVIKHFFDIEGLKFILAVDKNQLAKTVEVMFGHGTNTDCYLRKFVDLEYNLPDGSKKEYIDYLITQKFSNISSKINSFASNQKLLYRGYNSWDKQVQWLLDLDVKQQNLIQAQEKIQTILNKSNLCLREIEKCLLRLSITVEQLSESTDILEIGFLLQLISLNLKDPKQYNKASNNIDRNKIISEAIVYDEFNKINDYIWLRTNSDKPSTDKVYSAIYHNASSLLKYYKLIDFADGFE
jgi:predicted KAP-like P-loop ATPase